MNPVPLVRSLAVALLASSLAGQKILLADAGGREAAFVDASALLPRPVPGQEPDAEPMRRALGDLAAFVREFCEPELGPLHDVQPMGERFLAVLAEPRQIAFVERLVATARGEPKTAVLVDSRFYELSKDLFAQHVEPLLPKAEDSKVPVLADVPVLGFLFQQGKDRNSAARVAVVDAEKAAALHAALARAEGVNSMVAPKLLALPMQAASISTGEEVSYRKDYECKVEAGAFVWEEVRDTVFDGVRLDATCGLLDGQRIALRFHLAVQDVMRPIPEFATTLKAKAPGEKEVEKRVTIELPHCVGIETRQSLVLKDGASALVVGDRGDGTFCVTTVSATRQK
ncbi:MAG: hypothetical protein JNN13_01840 [Planctomycetes bacterium]|nr:hypothetical protein [Planctomycetota bacterium]